MTRTLALLALIGLAACQQGGVWAHMPRDDSPDGQACRREVERDPELRRMAAAFTGGANRAQDDRVMREMREAIPQAWRACMTRRGAALPGGVEPVRRSGF